ncbi:trimeric LpxA-like protein [Umbelopsis sp. PMI_123]|nr:trimeric LpxA-like protein [Umbelopsis sp. PMI_123]
MSSRNKIKVGPKTIVCQEADLRGEITIGAGTVLHPRCRVVAEGGPIIFGANNIVEENAVIFNKNTTPLVIGDDNVFEVGCYVEGLSIGNRNIIEARGRLIGTTVVGNNCVIGSACTTDLHEQMEDNTTIYGADCSRRTHHQPSAAQASLHLRHLEYLREMLPKYNHLKQLPTDA